MIAAESARIATMPAGPERDEAQAAVDLVRKLRADRAAELKALRARVAEVTAALRTAETDADAMEEIGRIVGAATPQPWGTYIVLGSGLLAALWRAHSVRVSGRQIAESLAPVLTPEQRAEIDRSAVQKAGAKRIVDEALGEKTPLPI